MVSPTTGRPWVFSSTGVQDRPDDPFCRRELAETLVLAVGYGRTPFGLAEERSRLEQARQLAEQLIEERADYPEYQSLLAKIEVRQAALLAQMGERREASRLLEQAISLLEDLAERPPQSPQFAFLLATTLIAASGGAGTVDDPEMVRSRLQQAVSILDKLSAEYPSAARWAKPYLQRAEQRLDRARPRADTDHP